MTGVCDVEPFVAEPFVVVVVMTGVCDVEPFVAEPFVVGPFVVDVVT
jgi:hypothetical protein